MQFKPKHFKKLKGTTFADYSIIYHINDCYNVIDLNSFNSKVQLQFQKFENQIQQMNLILVDSVFQTILADVALEVFLNKVSSFNEYISSRKTFLISTSDYDAQYFKYKFFHFIHQLLYSNISSRDVCYGEIQSDKIYCLKNSAGELQFYSIYEQVELQLMLLDRMKLEINFEASRISKEEVKLNFKIWFP